MMRTLKPLLIAAILVTTSPQVLAARAGQLVTHEPAKPELSVMQGDGVDLGEAVEQVKRQCDGRIVSAVTRRNGNRETHVIKCLTQDGTVRTFRIPGRQSV